MDPTTAPPPSEALCEICSSQPAKYTCPRCHVKSCSLACSRTHKTTTACSGQRDKAAYVPMKDYGYGKMMDDYVFLEDGKRKAEQWSKEIVGLKMGTDRSTMEGNASGPRQAVLSSKTLALQQALREKGMFVDFLPEGMERRRRNQSHYNPKYVSTFLCQSFFRPVPTYCSDALCCAEVDISRYPWNSDTPPRDPPTHREPTRTPSPKPLLPPSLPPPVRLFHHTKCKTSH
jgi:hypothetical protein